MLTGVLGFIDGYRDQPYQDMLGLEVLPSKLGSAAAAGILRILQRRGITVVYHFMSDACTTNIGHRTGAIAHLRIQLGTRLIFIIRCGAHIIARTWAFALYNSGGRTLRTPIKRKAEAPAVSAEVLLLECVAYVLKKWAQLKARVQETMQEKLLRISGCVFQILPRWRGPSAHSPPPHTHTHTPRRRCAPWANSEKLELRGVAV